MKGCGWTSAFGMNVLPRNYSVYLNIKVQEYFCHPEKGSSKLPPKCHCQPTNNIDCKTQNAVICHNSLENYSVKIFCETGGIYILLTRQDIHISTGPETVGFAPFLSLSHQTYCTVAAVEVRWQLYQICPCSV